MENEENYNEEIFTLTDEDGKELHFEFLGKEEIDGTLYLALYPIEDNDAGEYVVLKYEDDGEGNEVLVTIDDDDEYDRVADYFEDELFSELDHDASDDSDEKK